MPRQPNIAWRPGQRQRLSRTVASFNAKITRTLKAAPELAEYLPQRVSVSAARDNIGTARDLNRYVNSLRRVFREGAFTPITTQGGIKTTQWAVNEATLVNANRNRRRARERAKANVSPEKGTMGTIEEAQMQPRRFDLDKMSPADWQRFVAAAEKEVNTNYVYDRAEKYKEDYLRAVYENLGEEGEELYYMVASMDAMTIYENFYTDPILQIGFISDPLPVEVIVQAAVDGWFNFMKRDERIVE